MIPFKENDPMKMHPRWIATPLAAIVLLSPGIKAEAASVTTISDSIIQPGGPRTSGGTLVDFFFNAEGNNNGSNASYAVADFSGLHLGITSLSQLNSLSLTLTQANAAFTANGTVGVYLSTDTITPIGLGSPLKFQSSSSPTGLGAQLNNALGNSLGTSFAFVQVANGHQDVLNLLPSVSGLSAAAQSFLLNALDNGSDIRLVVAPQDANVVATWAGINNTSPPGTNPPPILTATAVPEPSSVILIGLGLAGTAIIAACRRVSGTATGISLNHRSGWTV
jgi:hypothetical protein